MKVRWGRAALLDPGASRIRWGRAEMAGTSAVVVAPIPSLTGVEPETAVSVTVTANQAPDSWSARAVTGSIADLAISSGGVVTFTAPSGIDGATITIGVSATKDSITSAEVMFSVEVLPQTEWWWDGSGWIPDVATWT